LECQAIPEALTAKLRASSPQFRLGYMVRLEGFEPPTLGSVALLIDIQSGVHFDNTADGSASTQWS